MRRNRTERIDHGNHRGRSADRGGNRGCGHHLRSDARHPDGCRRQSGRERAGRRNGAALARGATTPSCSSARRRSHRREEALARKESELEKERAALAESRQELERSLEQVSGLSAGRAKQLLLKEVEEQAKHDAARRIRQIEEETKREAERRVRNILSVCMQRLAAGHAAETTVSVVQLSADDMKGRIIGREGRNIRALENLTGVDFIIDDTPGAVVLSGFDGVRREIARLTLEKLLQDGRIHPARIEEMYYQAKSELEGHIVEMGEQAVFDAGVQGVHPELIKLLGPAPVPDELRPERARALDRGVAAGAR